MEHKIRRLLSYTSGLLLIGTMVVVKQHKTRGRKAKTSTLMQLQQSIRLNKPPDC
jgi:hypothetical protein